MSERARRVRAWVRQAHRRRLASKIRHQVARLLDGRGFMTDMAAERGYFCITLPRDGDTTSGRLVAKTVGMPPFLLIL